MQFPEAERELEALGVAVRRAYVASPPAEVAERHIAAMLAEAERIAAAGSDAQAVTAAPRRRRRVPALRLAAVVGASFLATAGLAVAGVRPPEPFSDLYEAVGFDVPGSDRDSDVGDTRGEGTPASGVPATPASGSTKSKQGGEDRPGKRQGQQPGHPSEEGQKTAAEARSGGTPPTDPGRSEYHPAPQGGGPDGAGPPGQSKSNGSPGHGQGSSGSAAPASPPGRTRSRGNTSRGPRNGLPAQAQGTPAGGLGK